MTETSETKSPRELPALQRSIVMDDEHIVWAIRAMLEMEQEFAVTVAFEDANGKRGHFWRLHMRYNCRPAHIANHIYHMPDAPDHVKPEREVETWELQSCRAESD